MRGEGSYIERILFYIENNKGQEIAIKCHPDNKDKFDIESLKSIEIITDDKYEKDGFLIGEKESILDIT